MIRRSSVALWALAAALAVPGCKTVTTVNGVPVADTTVKEADARKRAEIRTELASSYYQSRQLSVALQEVQRALAIDDSYAPAHALHGLIFFDLGDPREAEAAFGRALKLSPDSGSILNTYGWFLCQSGREKESVAYFNRAAADRLYPTPGMALRNGGQCLLKINEIDGAERMLRQAFERDASDPTTKLELAKLYLNKRQYDRAGFYYGLLDRAGTANAQALWVGIRVARAKGDVRTERDLSAELRRRFPESAEASALRRGAYDD